MRADATTGATAGSGNYLYQLPAGLTFNSALTPFYTGTGVCSNSHVFSFAIPTTIGSVTVSGYWGHDLYVIPYDATRFRLLVVNGNSNNYYINSGNYNLNYTGPYVLRANFNLER
jgi:hypothetical protein